MFARPFAKETGGCCNRVYRQQITYPEDNALLAKKQLPGPSKLGLDTQSLDYSGQMAVEQSLTA